MTVRHTPVLNWNSWTDNQGVGAGRWCMVLTGLISFLSLKSDFREIETESSQQSANRAKYTCDRKNLRFSTNVSLYLGNGTKQDKDIRNRKSYETYWVTPLLMTLNDREGHKASQHL